MTDVIKNINQNNQLNGTGSKPATKTSGETDTQKSSTPGTQAMNSADQVNLTSSAQKVDQLITSLSTEPVVDRQKVEEIKTALAEGRYEVNSNIIADKLIEMDELLK